MNNKIPTYKLVIIDDDFVVRQIIKTFIFKLSIFLKVNIEIYSSDNGVEGLGLIYVIDPKIIIIDSTLPKYSGREVIEYLISNEKFLNKKILITHDNSKDISIPGYYKLFIKNEKTFLRELLNNIEIDITNADKIRFHRNFFGKFSILMGTLTIIWSNRSQLILRHSESKMFIIKFLFMISWLISQVITSIYFTIVYLISYKVTESNITQQRIDLSQFRVRYYPTIVALLVAIFVLLLQAILCLIGEATILGLRVNNLVQK